MTLLEHLREQLIEQQYALLEYETGKRNTDLYTVDPIIKNWKRIDVISETKKYIEDLEIAINSLNQKK